MPSPLTKGSDVFFVERSTRGTLHSEYLTPSSSSRIARGVNHIKTLIRVFLVGLCFVSAGVSASSQCTLPMASTVGKWPWDDTIFHTPTEMLQSKCTANLAGSVVTPSTVVQWTIPTRDAPYPQWFGVCFIAPTNPQSDSPRCKPDFTGGSCSADDGSSSILETIVMDTPECNGKLVGRLICGGGDNYYRCPMVDPVKSIGSCGEGNPINCNIANKHQIESDIVTSNSLLNFVRTYNSVQPVGYAHKFVSNMGSNWRHSFSRVIFPLGAQNPSQPGAAFEVSAQRANGQVLTFSRNATSGLWETTSEIHHQLKDRLDANNVFIGYEFDNVESDETEIYDSSGRLLSVTARSGLTVTVEYDSAGLKKVTDSFGHSLTFQLTGGLIQQVTAPNGDIYQYQYDTLGNLTFVTYPDTTQRQYQYNEPANTNGANLPNALTGITDEAGQRFATFQYDGTGLATVTKHAGDTNQYTLSYPSLYSSSVVTEPLGGSKTQAFVNVSGSIKLASSTRVAAVGGGTMTSSLSYDDNGNVASKTDFNNITTNYAYDLSRNLETSRTEAANSPNARTITTTWHATYHLPTLISTYAGNSATGTAIRTTSFTYDSAGNLFTKTITDPATSTSRTWTYTYNNYGQVLTADGSRTDVSDISTYTYYTCNTGYQCGQVNTITNAAGQTTTFNTYNADGQPLTITDANGTVTTLTYDARQRMASRTVGTEVTSFAYYPTGLLQTITLPDASTLTYSYDGAHRLTQIQDGQGNKVVYTLDGAGNHTAENLYDPSSNLARTHSRVFNSLSQLYQDINAANTAAVTTTFGYDNNGNQTTINAPLTRNSSNQYDALNRVKQTTDPNNGITQYTYDANDNLTSVIDPRGLTTSYIYNGVGDLLQQQSPDTQTTINTYDSAGNLKTSTDANNNTVTYSYDQLNRVTQALYSDQTINYTYDQNTNGKGHLSSLTDSSGSTSYTYTTLGRINSKTQTTDSITKSIAYNYNSAGQLTQLTTPSGQNVTYTYSNGRLATLSVNGTALINSISYDPFGPVKQWTWGNGTQSSRSYDQDGYLTTNSSAGSSTYTFNPDGSIATQTNDTSANLNLTTGLETFTNATTSNKLSSISGAVTKTYSYDNVGHTLSDGTRSFTYNAAGRLTTATNAGVTTTYTYNALGQRVNKSNTNGTTYFVYDEAGHELGEYDASGALIQELVWLGDIPVATIRTDQSGGSVGVFYIHTDHLNAPAKITRPSDNQVIWRWDHDPYGNGVPNEDPDGNGLALKFNLRFPGQYYDAETGLLYNMARYYDQSTGRYISSDPIGLAGGLNTYAYVGGNPISSVDPSGLFCTSAGGWTSCSFPGGGPAFRIPTPPGFPAKLDTSSFKYHKYHVPFSGKCPEKDLLQALINHPAPGNSSPATPSGTPNTATVFGLNNPVKSYVTTDLNTGAQVVVNVTTGTGFMDLSPGYVVRTVSGNGIDTYGEGTAWQQATHLWGDTVQDYLDRAVWEGEAKKLLEKCGCNQ